MKRLLWIAVLTLVLLGLGFGVGIWTERRRPLPPPPFPFLGEMLDRSQPPSGKPPGPPLIDRAELAAEIEQMRPQIEAFRRQLDQIENDFDRDLRALLSPAQAEIYGARQQLKGRFPSREEVFRQPPKSVSAEQISRLQQRPMFHVVDMVVVALRLDWLNRELKLDDTQREKVRALLLVRREKFLALTDSAPLPSLFLSRLAPLAERLAEPPK
jgi:hypothetical protein